MPETKECIKGDRVSFVDVEDIANSCRYLSAAIADLSTCEDGTVTTDSLSMLFEYSDALAGKAFELTTRMQDEQSAGTEKGCSHDNER